MDEVAHEFAHSKYFMKLKLYATDETQSVGSSTGVMTPSFTILSNSALTLGYMKNGHISRGHV